MDANDAEALLKLDEEAAQIYDKDGVEQPPGKDSNMTSKKKVKFFIEMLQLYDSGSDKNKSLPLHQRLFYNRRYNNTYRHAVDNFKTREMQMLTTEMMRLKVGDAFRSGYRG